MARNAASGFATLGLGALLGFVVTPILLHHLGTAGFGTWSLVLGVVSYVGLVEGGLGLATIARVAATEREGPAAVSAVLSTSMRLFGIIASVASVATVVLAILFPLLFHVPQSLRSEAEIAVLFAGASQSLALVGNVYVAALLGTGRMYLVNTRGFIVSAVVTIAQAVVVLAGGGIVELGAVLPLGGIATLYIYRDQVRRSMRRVVVAAGRSERAVARRLVSHAWRNSVTSTSSYLAYGSDVVVVGLLINPVAAAGYAVALRVSTLLTRIATGVSGTLGPSHGYAASRGDSDRRFDIYCLGLSVSLALALVSAVAVGTYAHALLRLWLGHPPPDAALVLTILCVLVPLQIPGQNSYSLLMNSESTGELMWIVVASGLVNIVASLVFTSTIGVVGPALGSLVAVTVFEAIWLPKRTCNLLGKRISALVRRVFVPLLLPLVVFLGVLGAGRVIVPTGPPVLAVMSIAVAAFLGCWSFTSPARQIRAILR
ncbi:MAG: oligosaccharide flippase family protein [Solirubrobacteraceae bacterium]